MQGIYGVVDVIHTLEAVCNVLVNGQLSGHRLLHQLRHLRARLVAPKGSATQPAPGHKLQASNKA